MGTLFEKIEDGERLTEAPAPHPEPILHGRVAQRFWWNHATEEECQITYSPYGDGARSPFSATANIYHDSRSDPKMRVKDVFESSLRRRIQRSRQCTDLGATPVASVFYRLASDTYWRLGARLGGPFGGFSGVCYPIGHLLEDPISVVGAGRPTALWPPCVVSAQYHSPGVNPKK